MGEALEGGVRILRKRSEELELAAERYRVGTGVISKNSVLSSRKPSADVRLWKRLRRMYKKADKLGKRANRRKALSNVPYLGGVLKYLVPVGRS